jgi:hypothetical protein
VIVRMRPGVIMAAVLRIVLGQIVMMKVKEPLNEEHDGESREYPGRSPIDAFGFLHGVRQQVQNTHAEHQASNEARGYLQAGTGQSHPKWNPSAQQ